MHVTKAILAVTFLSSITISSLIAKENENEDGKEKREESRKPQKLSEVVVSATKTTRSTESVSNSVTVISEDVIKAKGHSTVADVLTGALGIDVSRNGGSGTATSIFMRGADSKNVLLLVDGIPYNDPSLMNRNAVLSNLSTDNVERIEIIRGPQSVLYGSNATAGVINVITKEGVGKPSVTYVGEGGTYGTFRNRLSSSGSLERLSYSLSAESLESKGFSVANADNKDLPADGNTSEKDGYRRESYSGKIKYRFTDDFYLKITGHHTEAEVELDDFGNGHAGDKFIWGWPSSTPVIGGPHKNEMHSDETIVRADVHNLFADDLFESNFYGSYSEFKRQGYDNDGGKSYDGFGKVEQYGWQGNLNTTNNVLSIGGDLYREFYKSTVNAINENADTRSAWFQNQLEVGGFYTVAGARYDRHDRFGEHVTWRVAPAYTFASNTKIKASYGTGFRSPSLFELYSTYGNLALQPEESSGWDAGMEQRIGDSFIVGAIYFETEYKDMIAYDFAISRYNQMDGDTDVRGVEFYSTWQAADSCRFAFTYTYTDTEADDGSRLIRRPLHKAMLSTTLKFMKNAGMNLDTQYVGDRDAGAFALDKNGNPVEELDNYLLVNLSAYYRVHKRLKFFARVDNVFDEKYEYAFSYATPGRSYYVGCSVTF